jgi:hypothetical protein
MTPKTPEELREQLERANERSAEKGKDRTAEGMEARRPSRGEFFGNLKKVSEPDK